MEVSRTGNSLLILFFLFHLTIFTVPSSSATKHSLHNQRNIDFLRSSCNTTTYPRLCYRILCTYATEINTSRKLLAYAALNVTLKAANNTSRLMKRIARIHGLKPRVAAAMADCIELVGDSVEELRDSISELSHINRTNFEIVVGDIQTWVSAALTDEDTCMDGFEEEKGMNGEVKVMVRRRILKVTRFISVALALVNNFASSHRLKSIP